MKYDFDCICDITNTDCMKWDTLKAIFGHDDVIPMWVADMDFPVAQPIVEALKKRTEREIYGYTQPGPSVTEASLAMADFVFLFTTVPRDRLLCEQVLALYGLRWQVELEFKRNKSLTGLDRLPNFRPDTIESWLYAKLLLHQLLRRVSTDSADFSPSDIARAALVVDRRSAPRCPDCAAYVPSCAAAWLIRRTSVARHAGGLEPRDQNHRAHHLWSRRILGRTLCQPHQARKQKDQASA